MTLIERLRELGELRRIELVGAGCSEAEASWCIENQAAEALEQAQAEIERLSESLDLERDAYMLWKVEAEKLQDRVERLEKEKEHLKEIAGIIVGPTPLAAEDE